MIRIENVSHRFGSLQVLNNLSLDIHEGAIFGFIGPNGAGKTTTIRMMATLLEPDHGRVLVDGVDVVEDPAEVRRRIGFMPDAFGVYENITVHEYLDFFAAAHQVPLGGRKRTLDAVVELTDLGNLRERLVAQLSKGMRQRLAIARTLLHDPKVLILDEPANGLDPRARVEMRDLIRHLQQLGKTIVLSSHILTELADMCDALAIIEKGTLMATGSVDEVSRALNPHQTVVLALLSPPDDTVPILLSAEGVLDVSADGAGSFDVSYEGGDQTVANIVATAVGAGLQILRVDPTGNDLERIFMNITRGEVQ